MNKLTYLLLLPFLLFFIGCSSDDTDDIVIVSTTDYVLPAGCQWKFLLVEEKANTLTGAPSFYRVDTQEQFDELVEYTTKDESAKVDFEKYTLMVVQARMPATGYYTFTSLATTSAKEGYTFTVDLMATWMQPQEPSKVVVALLAPKLKESANVGLSFVVSGYDEKRTPKE